LSHVPTLPDLLAQADTRHEWAPDDSRSGARFERVVVGGVEYVLKYQDPRDDWLLRASGDPGHRYVLLWESGLLAQMPDVIDHAVVGAEFDGTVGRVLLRDVGDQLLEPGRAFSYEQHRRFISHMAALHTTFWDFHDEVGLTPLDRRYLLFSPHVAAAEAALGSPAVVPRLMAEGWAKLPDVSAPLAQVVLPLLDDPAPLLDALAGQPHVLVHGDWKAANIGSHADGRTVLLDFGEAPGEASPLADLSWYLALNSDLLPESKDEALSTYRAALEERGVSTGAWWDSAVALEMLGCMLQFGWEKALGGPGEELAWWERQALEGAALLGVNVAGGTS
jgi:hypothetical protein